MCGIGDNVYTTEGRTKIRITLAGYLVYFFDIWIGDLSGQNVILGMDFMVPAGVWMGLADGSMRLPDEVGIPLNGCKRLYGEKVRSVILERSLRIPVGRSEETAARIKLSVTEKLWVTRGERWVPTVTEGSEEILRLDHRLDVGMILDQDKVPRSPRFMSVGSRRYREWQNLALESKVDSRSDPPEPIEDPAEPAVPIPRHDRYFAGQKPLISTEIERGYESRNWIGGRNCHRTPDRGNISQPRKGAICLHQRLAPMSIDT
ncbi:hypothetical protein PHMEG_00027383 [Phytophthora megakarya]|uniref:Eukaryotic/viral aspartic protease n=1 Tax=Phytophthora megakarya TaxID=4795 RepID=A0A225V901_9STRA|nr:hypothetical protein PHMEG_00027383 [Phytophthora megakarya]